MSHLDKIAFAEDLIDSVKGTILRRLNEHSDLVEDWDGVELRQYIADQFVNQTVKITRNRQREYRNTIAISNL